MDLDLPVVHFPRKRVVPADFQAAAANGTGTEYFQGFNLGFLVQARQPAFATTEVLRVLQECREADPQAFARIHKGGPYYWLGMSAFLMRDFVSAVFYIDAAVAEDLRRDPQATETPAILFLMLRGEHPSQAAKDLVEMSQALIEGYISTYLKYEGRDQDTPDLTLEDLRSYFLSRAIRPESRRLRSVATALISFMLEGTYRKAQLDNIPSPTSFDPFILHMFKGGLILESLIKLNPTKRPRGAILSQVLPHVSSHLGVAQGLNISARELQDVIRQAGSATWTIENAFQVAGRARNTTGHSLGWEVRFTFDEYGAIVQNLAVSCLHTIAALYRTPFRAA